ncbi:MAG: hypothetical protein M3N32_07595 [Actinomycetota bacterium]|nr:hypothetical protein [Actinomycetota bacterium]
MLFFLAVDYAAARGDQKVPAAPIPVATQLVARDFTVARADDLYELVSERPGRSLVIIATGMPRTGIAVPVTGVLTENGPEPTSNAFTGHLGDLDVAHHRIPPRSPNHNAVCERFQGTARAGVPAPRLPSPAL